MMTSGHVGEARLSEYVDGVLPADAGDRVRSHLASCAACAAEAERVEALRAAAAALPRALDPGVDLRPGIRAEVRRREARRARRRALRELRRPLAAAAAVLVVATASVTALVVRSLDGPAEVVVAAGGGDEVARTFETLEREYARAAADLRRALESEAERLTPGTARLVRENLAAVDRALAESRAALREDPGSPVLRELVLAAHRQRLDVLRRVTTLAAES